ncbi:MULTISPECIES: hypothetical protein [unclassified Lysinibacillus]|uniref:hypothetical protein n=1 Tax=unclassified Lysinibacillus TaxID=2636778 RepID=UPI003817BF10
MSSSNKLQFDYLMAFSNIIKELRYFGNYSPLNVFNKYSEYIAICDQYRINNNFHKGFKKTEGFSIEKLQQLYTETGFAIIGMHYGAYKPVQYKITDELIKVHPDKKILLVVDEESYNSESASIEVVKTYSRQNVEMIIAEKSNSALKIVRHLKNGGVVILYLDGMTGYGEDKYPIQLPFISSEIKIRSGIFRLLEKVKVPVIGVITPEIDEILISLPIQTNNVNSTASNVLSFFRPTILKEPSLWRLWYRHHMFCENYPNVLDYSNENVDIEDWICEDISPTLVLNKETGDIYQKVGNN